MKLEMRNGRYYVDGEPSRRLTQQDLRERFKLYDEAYFGGSLPECRLYATMSASRMVGMCIPSANEIYLSRLNKYVWTDTIIKKILIHEMIHLYIYNRYRRVGRYLNSFHHMWPFAYEVWRLNRRYHLGLKLLDYIPTKAEFKA